MADCELSETCAFFLSDGGYSPQLNETMKQLYCKGDCTVCARYLAVLKIGRENVPASLMPTDHDRLESLSRH